jgi:hypothetical protein
MARPLVVGLVTLVATEVRAPARTFGPDFVKARFDNPPSTMFDSPPSTVSSS